MVPVAIAGSTLEIPNIPKFREIYAETRGKQAPGWRGPKCPAPTMWQMRWVLVLGWIGMTRRKGIWPFGTQRRFTTWLRSR